MLRDWPKQKTQQPFTITHAGMLGNQRSGKLQHLCILDNSGWKCKLNIMVRFKDVCLVVCAWIYLCLYVCEWLMAEERGEGLLPGGLAGLFATVQWSLLLLLFLTHITTSLTLNRPPIFRWPIAFGTVCTGAVWIITLLHNEDWTIMKTNTVSTNYKIEFVCLSLLSGWLIFFFFF